MSCCFRVLRLGLCLGSLGVLGMVDYLCFVFAYSDIWVFAFGCLLILFSLCGLVFEVVALYLMFWFALMDFGSCYDCW